MPNIAAVLKAEIARVARKEVRSEVNALRKTLTSQRSVIASLKKRADIASKELRRLGKRAEAAVKAPIDSKDDAVKLRFSANGLKSRRVAMGLSANDLGLLLGTTGQSVYKWEQGEARPRAKYLPAIAEFRKMGKRQLEDRLAAARTAA